MKLAVRIRCEAAGGWRAWCPALPGCSVRGSSAGEASRRIADAVRSYVDSLRLACPPALEPYVTEQSA